jgi:hypothetical protein
MILGYSWWQFIVLVAIGTAGSMLGEEIIIRIRKLLRDRRHGQT